MACTTPPSTRISRPRRSRTSSTTAARSWSCRRSSSSRWRRDWTCHALPRLRHRLMVDGVADGWESYEDVVGKLPASPIDDECEGDFMLYSSGTTGRPEGHPATVDACADGGRASPAPSRSCERSACRTAACTSTPLRCTTRHRSHGRAVRIAWAQRSWSWSASIPLDALRLIEERRVTHTQMVPTMFVRLLKLPDEGARSLRSGVAASGRPRSGAVPRRGQAPDDRMVGTDHLGVLLLDRRRRCHVHHERGMAGASRVGGQADDRQPTHPGRRRATSCRRGRSGRSTSKEAFPSSTTTTRRRPLRPGTSTAGRRSATSATSTRTGTST